MIILLCLGHASGPEIPGYGLYLRDFDFEAAHDERAPAGSGRAEFTDDPAKAKQFRDAAEFHQFYTRVPKCAPVRWWSDCGDNRPMTGYHWQFVTVPDGA